MLFRLFPLGKATKQKHTIEVTEDKESLQKMAEDILNGEENVLSLPSAEKLNTNVLKGNNTSGYELDPKTAEIIKAAEKLMGNNKQKKSLELFTLDRKYNQESSIKNSASEETVDPEVQEIIFKLYPRKHMHAIILGTSTLSLNRTPHDELFAIVGRFIIEKNKASIGIIQRVFKIGFNRASRVMDQLAEAGVVSEESSTRTRQILMTMPEFESFLEKERNINNDEEHGFDGDLEDVSDDLWSHRSFYFSHEAFRKAEEYLNRETEAFLTEKFQVAQQEVYRSFAAIENLKRHKNCLITNSTFSAPLSFVLTTMKKCSPAHLHLILIDDKQYFSKFCDYYLLMHSIRYQEKHLLEILKWCIEERDKRQNSTFYRGQFKYESGSDTNELPIMIVVRELYSILQIKGIREKLLQLLVNSYQFGIYLIGFSQYDQINLGINPFRNMVDFLTDNEVFELFTEDKTNQGGKFPDQLFSTSESMSSGKLMSIDNMDGISFEKYCASVLKVNGFTNINVTKASGDYGADIVAVKDQIKYAIQCKRSLTPIGSKAVQEVIASRSVYNCHVGVVLTNNHFTNNARVLASKNNILLWDRHKLLKMALALKS